MLDVRPTETPTLRGASSSYWVEGRAIPYYSPADSSCAARISNPAEGQFVEVCAPGALSRFLASGKNAPIQYSHGSSAITDNLPLTEPPEYRSTDTGLTYRARVLPGVSEHLLAAVATGQMRSSIRFYAVRESYLTGRDAPEWAGDWPVRVLDDLELIETSLVWRPAYPATSAKLVTA